MTEKSMIHRYLDPGETLGEVLFGLIMALTFTLGERLLTARDEFDALGLVLAAVGCNIAWGAIDAVLFVLGNLFHRSRRAGFLRAVKAAGNEAAAMAVIRDEFELDSGVFSAAPADSNRVYEAMLELARHGTVVRAGITRGDLVGAFVVFVLVSATALPGVLPFLLIGDSYLALRVSNFVLVALLFLVGYWWAHYTDARPLRIGLAVTVLGLCLVLLAVALGG